MRITSKGQVTIPQDVREKAGLMPGTDVEFQIDERGVHVIKATTKSKRPTRGERLVDSLRGAGDIKMSTDEIMALMRGDPAE